MAVTSPDWQNPTESFAVRAERLYLLGNQRGARICARKALEEDIRSPAAWDVLYALHGEWESLESFQLRYTAENYPGSLNALRHDLAQGETLPVRAHAAMRGAESDASESAVPGQPQQVESAAGDPAHTGVEEIIGASSEAAAQAAWPPDEDLLKQFTDRAEAPNRCVLQQPNPRFNKTGPLKPLGKGAAGATPQAVQVVYETAAASGALNYDDLLDDLRAGHPPARGVPARGRGDYWSCVLQAVLFIPYAAFYAVPAVIVGEFLLYLLTLLFSGGEGVAGGLLIGAVSLAGLSLLAFAAPLIGQLLYNLLAAIIIAGAAGGGLVGLNVGLALALVYGLTRWLPTLVTGSLCAAAGGASGWLTGALVNQTILASMIRSDPAWGMLNIILFTLLGAAAGVIFAGVAGGTELGEACRRRAARESASSARLKSPLRSYIKLANLAKGPEGEEREGK